jgi:acetyl-CoA acetyltransferase
MTQRDIFVVGTARTAIGTFGGALKDVPNTQLATTAVKAAIERSGVAADAIGHVVMGNVIPTDVKDAYLSRVAAIDAAAPSRRRPSTSTACAARACRPSCRRRRRLRWAIATSPSAAARNR